MELKFRKFIKNGNVKLPTFSDGNTGPINFTNQLYQHLDKEWHPDFETISMPDVISPVSISGISDNIISQREQELSKKEQELSKVPLSEPIKSKTNTTSNGINLDNLGLAIQTGANLIKTIGDTSTTDKTVDSILEDAGTSEGMIGGISYKRIKPIYKDGKLPKYGNGTSAALGGAASGASFGASVGSIIPGIGTGIGAAVGGILGGITGWLGNESREEEEERLKREAEQRRLAVNQYNFSGALSQYLQQREALQSSEPRYEGGKNPTLDSAFGMIKGQPNALVDKGEWIINTLTGNAHKVNRGAGDNAPAYIRPEDAILSKKRGAADYFERTGDLTGAIKMNKNQYSCGKLPKMAEGWIPNAIVSGFGALAGLNQYFDARNQTVKRARTYVSNPYTANVLQGLAGLQYNPYPIINQLKNRQAYLNYSLNNSGGLSGSQKYLGKIANANNMYKVTADVLTDLQERNLGLRSNYYSTMANLGAQDAQRRQSANQYDLDYYSKARAARQSGMQMGIYNMLNQIQNWYANDFKRRQFNDTMSLYRQDRDRELKKLKAQFPNYNFS